MFRTKKKWQELQEAVRQDDAEKVTKITRHLKIRDKEEYYAACTLAVEHGASRALKALLDQASFNFHPTDRIKEKQYVRQLINAASLSSNAYLLLSVLDEKNEAANGRHQLRRAEFLNKDTPTEFIQACLQKQPSLFDDCVNNVGLLSTDTQKLGFILDRASMARDAQSTLDRALAGVARKGDLEKAKLLLDHNANPNYDRGVALLRACEGGHQEMVDFLLLHTKPALCSDIVSLLERSEHRVPPAIISSIKAAVDEAVPQGPEIDGFTRVDDHTLSMTQPLDRTPLTIRFNLLLQQQIFIKTVDGAPVVDKVISLDELKPEVIADLQEKLDILNGKKAVPKPPSKTGLRLR